MVLDIILVIICIVMMLYGYKKGCISIVFKLVSLIIAFALAYFLADTVGQYVQNTSVGIKIENVIQNTVSDAIKNTDSLTYISTLQDKLNVEDNNLFKSILEYVFWGIGFAITFILARLILFIAQNIIEKVFDLPVLKTFNNLAGLIASVVIFLIEVSIIFAIIESLSGLEFMSKLVNTIQSSVITKWLYDHNIITNIILKKII